MANDVSSNPWTLDTVGSAAVIPTTVFVEHFEFIDYELDTDSCQIKNGVGKVIWEANGATDLQPIRSGKIGAIQKGLYLSVLDNANSRVRVYIR